ncbi:MAG TPA: hypothetical protein VF242_05875 [Nitrososphaeraceae archaeon]
MDVNYQLHLMDLIVFMIGIFITDPSPILNDKLPYNVFIKTLETYPELQKYEKWVDNLFIDHLKQLKLKTLG